MMALKVLLMLFVGADALRTKIQEPETKNAYVVMWIAKKNVPKTVDLKFNALTAEEEETELKEMAAEGSTSAKRHIANFKQKRMEESLEQENVGPKGYRNAMKIAKQLQAVGAKHPLVMLTNDEKLIAIKNNATLKKDFPNVVIREVGEGEWLDHTCRMASNNKYHFQKLQVFGMDDYDKLLWMDLDVSVRQNLDKLFVDPEYDLGDGNHVFGQKDNWNCEPDVASKAHEFCSGVMLFKPSKRHLEGLLDQGRHMGWCWGDQKLIAKYFAKEGRSKKLFPKSVVNWGHCGSKHSMLSHDQVLGSGSDKLPDGTVFNVAGQAVPK